MKNKHDFYVYPTLLDGYNYAKKSGNYQDVFDRINKVKKEMPEFVLKGSSFEHCVNAKIDGINLYSHDGFTFDNKLVDKIAYKLQNCTSKQKWIEKIVPFSGGNLRVGGFVDYLFDDKIVDLKTTQNYRLSKYKDNNQTGAYGLILPEKKEFIYLATDFTNYYIEPYKNTKDKHDEFISNVEEFYLFCKENESLIKDRKIFGE